MNKDFDPYGFSGFSYLSNSLPNGRAIVMTMYTNNLGINNNYFWMLYPPASVGYRRL